MGARVPLQPKPGPGITQVRPSRQALETLVSLHLLPWPWKRQAGSSRSSRNLALEDLCESSRNLALADLCESSTLTSELAAQTPWDSVSTLYTPASLYLLASNPHIFIPFHRKRK